MFFKLLNWIAFQVHHHHLIKIIFIEKAWLACQKAPFEKKQSIWKSIWKMLLSKFRGTLVMLAGLNLKEFFFYSLTLKRFIVLFWDNILRYFWSNITGKIEFQARTLSSTLLWETIVSYLVFLIFLKSDEKTTLVTTFGANWGGFD